MLFNIYEAFLLSVSFFWCCSCYAVVPEHVRLSSCMLKRVFSDWRIFIRIYTNDLFNFMNNFFSISKATLSPSVITCQFRCCLVMSQVPCCSNSEWNYFGLGIADTITTNHLLLVVVNYTPFMLQWNNEKQHFDSKITI